MSVVGEMIGNAYKTIRNIVLVILLVISLLWNATTLSLGVISTVISAAYEAVTGVRTVGAQLASKKAEVATIRAELSAAKKAASRAEGTAIGRGLTVAKEKAANTALRSEAKAAAQLASRLEGKAIGTALALEKEKVAKAALQTELASLRAGKKVIIDGVEMTAEQAVLQATKRVRTRTAKLAVTDLSATFGQAIPWIGVSVVVAATAYDLKSACDTMRDMRGIEIAFNPFSVDDADVERVCGLKVPSEQEIWEGIKASPGMAWHAAKSVLGSLPPMPAMPEFTWPSWP
jgi:hypothetical protein